MGHGGTTNGSHGRHQRPAKWWLDFFSELWVWWNNGKTSVGLDENAPSFGMDWFCFGDRPLSIFLWLCNFGLPWCNTYSFMCLFCLDVHLPPPGSMVLHPAGYASYTDQNGNTYFFPNFGAPQSRTSQRVDFFLSLADYYVLNFFELDIKESLLIV